MPNREAEVEGIKDAKQGVDAWVSFAGEGPVEGLTAQSTVGSDGGHTLGAGDVAQGFDEIVWVIFFQCRVEVRDHCFIAVEDFCDVPRGVLFFGHGASLELFYHPLSTRDVLLLATLVAPREENDHGAIADSEVDAVSWAPVDTKLADRAPN